MADAASADPPASPPPPPKAVCNIKEAGPIYWSYWQMLAYAFSKDGSDAQRAAVVGVLRTGANQLCCESCNVHATRIMAERGWDTLLNTALINRVEPSHPDSMFACVIKLHNWVNERLGRDPWTLERAVEVQAKLPQNDTTEKCPSCTLNNDPAPAPASTPDLPQAIIVTSDAGCAGTSNGSKSRTAFIMIVVAIVALLLIMVTLSFVLIPRASGDASGRSAPALRQYHRRVHQ